MAIIVNDLDAIFTMAPGTGSSALSEFLLTNVSGARQVPDSDIEVDGKVICKMKHSTVSELVAAELISQDRVARCRVVTGVRNPFDYIYAEWFRMRTRWVKLLKNNKSWVHKNPGKISDIIDSLTLDFNEFVKHKYGEMSGNRQLSVNQSFVSEANDFVRTENLSEDISRVLSEMLNEPCDYKVPLKNVTREDRDYWRHYDGESRGIIQNLYSEYMNRFGYVF